MKGYLSEFEMMKTLTTTLCLTIAVLLGSTGVSWSADFQERITFGTSSYDKMKSTITFSIPKESMSFVFEHSQKISTHKHVFSISFLGCKDMKAFGNISEQLELCDSIKGSNVVETRTLLNNNYNYKLSHPKYGTADLDFVLEADRFNVKTKFQPMRIRERRKLDNFQNFKAQVIPEDMSSVFSFNDARGERVSGKAVYLDDKIRLIVKNKEQEIDIDTQTSNFLQWAISNYEKYFLNKIPTYYFGGLSVNQGDVLNKKNHIIEGFRVIGKSLYHNREVVIMRPMIDVDALNYWLTLQDPESTAEIQSVDGFLFVDKDTGVLVRIYLNIPVSMTLNNETITQIATYSMETAFHLNSSPKKSSSSITKSSQSKQGGDLKERLRKLKEIYDEGIIEKEDYKKKVDELMKQL